MNTAKPTDLPLAASRRLPPMVRLLSATILGLSLTGCGQRGSVPPATAQQGDSAPAQQANSETSKPQAETAESNPVPRDQAAAADKVSSEKADESAAADSTQNEAAQEPPRERFILYTPPGPLVVELEIDVEGVALQEAFAQLIDHVLTLADTDQDGRPTWKELSTSRHFIYGQLGNVEIRNEQARRQMIRMYDTSKDGAVDRAEVPRFLTRNAGGSKAFSLKSSNLHRDQNVRRSPIRLLLDQDKDGLLSPAEISQSVARLRTKDTDDDEILLTGDFSEDDSQQMGRLPNQTRSGPDVAALLGDAANWTGIRTDMQEYYAFGGPLTADCFGLCPELFAALDENEDGEVDKQELPRLNLAPAQVLIRVDLGRRSPSSNAGSPDAEEGAAEYRLTVASLSESLGAIEHQVARTPQRLTLRLAGVCLEFFANDQLGAVQTAAALEAQFAMLDNDKNGYLDEDEVQQSGQALGLRFEAVDADGDGKAYPQELLDYLEQRQAAQRKQVRARVADHADALFTALDVNGDGRLSAREISQSSQCIAGLDRDGNGQIRLSEIPGSMVVGIVRGDPQQADAQFTIPAATWQAPSDSIPAWFLSMDANADGDISPREFLGSDQQFQQLDLDRDGFIAAQEAK